jgi:hypothetical protein
MERMVESDVGFINNDAISLFAMFVWVAREFLPQAGISRPRWIPANFFYSMAYSG